MVLTPILPNWLEPTDVLRLHVFIAALALLVILERLLPERPHHWKARATGNFSLQGINAGLALLLTLAAPLSLSSATLYAQFNQWGLFNNVQMGLWARIVIAWLVLDLVAYWWHRAWHAVPSLWRFHRIHHIDQALDVTTTFRTHPVESVATLLVKAAVVLSLGVPLLGIILYELIVATMALWIHGNVRLHPLAGRVLGWIVVTPGLHRIHHGATADECSRNFGLVLSLWDRLFGTYRAPSPDSSGPGLPLPADRPSTGLANLVLLPFRRPAAPGS